MARCVALDYVEHAFLTVTSESAFVLLCGEFGVSVACVDGSVEEASPVLLFSRVGQGGAERLPYLRPYCLWDIDRES